MDVQVIEDLSLLGDERVPLGLKRTAPTPMKGRREDLSP